MDLQGMDACVGSGGGGKAWSSEGPSTHSKAVKGSKMLMLIRPWWFGTKAVPKRYVSVDVGKEKKTRYLVPIPFLTHEEFRKLLEDSVVEFGHSYTGALRLACGEEELENVLHQIGQTLHFTKLITGRCLQPCTWYRIGHCRKKDD